MNRFTLCVFNVIMRTFSVCLALRRDKKHTELVSHDNTESTPAHDEKVTGDFC